MLIYTPANSISDGSCNKSTFSTVLLDRSPFMYSHAKGGLAFNVLLEIISDLVLLSVVFMVTARQAWQ